MSQRGRQLSFFLPFVFGFLLGAPAFLAGQSPIIPILTEPVEEDEGCSPTTEGPNPPLTPAGGCLGPQGGPDPDIPSDKNDDGGPGGTTGGRNGPGGGTTPGGGGGTTPGSGPGRPGGGRTTGGGGTTGGRRRYESVHVTPPWMGARGTTGGGDSPTTSGLSGPSWMSDPGQSPDEDLYSALPLSGLRGMDFLARLQSNSVETGRLGLLWGEIDAEYPGVTAATDLIIGRRYFSRSLHVPNGSVGSGWVHSLYERLFQIDATRLRHIDWNRPYNDPDHYYTWNGTSYWGPSTMQTSIEATTAWPGAAWVLKYKNGCRHYFDGYGKIVARVDASGQNAVLFQYNAQGDLFRVVDSRGQVFNIIVAGGAITTIIDPMERTLNYDVTAGKLTRIVYPAREVEEGPGESASTLRTTQRQFTYDAAGRLTGILGDDGSLLLGITYPDATSRAVATLTTGTGGVWQFYDYPSLSSTFAVTPRGFVRQFVLNSAREAIEMRQYITSINPATPSRPVPPGNPGYWSWQMLREGACNCGYITQIIEPDLGSWHVTYDARYNVTALEKRANGGGTAALRWQWTYDAQDRVTAFAPPEALALPNPAGLTWTWARAGDSAADNVGGTVITATNPANGIRSTATKWTWRFDTRHRLVEESGPSHDAGTLGTFDYYTYYPSGGPNSDLRKRHYTRRNSSLWSEATYNAAGRITQIQTNSGDAFSANWTWTQAYDAENRPIAWTGPARSGQQYQATWHYDAEGRLAKARWLYYDEDPYLGISGTSRWIEQAYAYDGEDQVILETRDLEPGVQAVTQHYYDADGNLLATIDPDGKFSGSLRDERDLPWRLFDGIGTAGFVERIVEYFPDGDVASVVEPFDSRWIQITRTYDAFDRLSRMELPGQTRVDLTHDGAGRLLSRTLFGSVNGSMAPLKAIALSYADWHESPTTSIQTVWDENGGSIFRTVSSTITYGPSGLPIQVSEGGTVYASFQYTESGEVRRVQDDLGNTEEFVFHAQSGFPEIHRILHADPLGGPALVQERRMATDPAGRVTGITYVAAGLPNRTEIYGYDSLDYPVTHVDTSGQMERASFRPDGKVLRLDHGLSGPSGVPLSREIYAWTPGGKLFQATDSRGNTQTWSYDSRGRRIRETNPDGSAWIWNFNSGDFVTRVTTPTGKVIEYLYEIRGFPTSRTVSQSGLVLRRDDWLWTPSGHLKRADKAEGVLSTFVEFTRDGDGHVLSEATEVPGSTVTYLRDGKGRLSSLTGPSGTSRAFTYDSRNRVREVADNAATPLAVFDYLGAGRALRQRVTRDGHTLKQDRNGFAETTRLHTSRAGGTATFDFAYGWDAGGRPTYEHRVHQAFGDVFRYDVADRLQETVRGTPNPVAEAAVPGSAPGTMRTTYGVDGAGHRTAVTMTPLVGAPSVTTYTTASLRNHYTAVGSQSRTYTADGNLNSHGTRTFTYDALDQLVSVVDGGVVTQTVTYDALDRRRTQTYGAVSERYVHAGPWLIEEYRTTGGTEALEAVHFHASGIDEIVLARRRDRADLDQDGNTTELIDLYVHVNRQGSTIALTTDNGQVVERYEYDAFGAPTIFDRTGAQVTMPPSGHRHLYTGREYDTATGLYHYRARTYDPATGTFLQEDPLGLEDSLNPVLYVLANPMLFVDPHGTMSVSEAVDGILNFLSNNAGLIAGLALDVIPMLRDIMDVLSAASGRDITGWMEGGFKGTPREMGWWERVKKGFSGGIKLLGSVVGTVARINCVIEKIQGAIEAAQAARNGDLLGAATSLAGAATSGCFDADTPVLIAESESQSIGEITLGQLVLTEAVSDPITLVDDDGMPEPDHHRVVIPHLWRRVVLQGFDATAETRVELLRPASSRLVVAATRDSVLTLSIPELGLAGDFQVMEIGLCPPIRGEQDATHRPVTAIVKRPVASTLDLWVEGQNWPITTTSEHLFWSQSRGDWVNAGSLTRGEKLQTLGPAAVTPIVLGGETRPDRTFVFNLEVHRSHTYGVGACGLVVHNDCKKKQTGSYTIEFENGMKYHGKGGEARMKRSIREKERDYKTKKKHAEWEEAATDEDAYRREHQRIKDDRGPGGGRSRNYNMINSPGANM